MQYSSPPLISPQGCVPQLVSNFHYIHGVIAGVTIVFGLGILIIFFCALIAIVIIAVTALIALMIIYLCCLCIATCCCKDAENNERESTDLLTSQETTDTQF